MFGENSEGASIYLTRIRRKGPPGWDKMQVNQSIITFQTMNIML
jgi:hypothetical protein